MTIYYVDPINGNDASAGTSFATRWQTLTTGAGTGKVAAGDTIRVIASPDPTSMAQNATWTDGSSIVTLTTAVTKDISQSTTAWTPSTNVTSTTSANRKLGSTASSIAIAAAFTTGKAAYLNLGAAVDASAYQQISFWINMTVGTMAADGDISLRLCSDTIGNTTVHTIPIRRFRATGTYQANTFDNAAALSSSIQSIALYVEVDRGAQTFLINNILACKATSSPDSITLDSLISKNTDYEAWTGISAISDTSVYLDFNALSSIPTSMPAYSGDTSTQLLYKRQPMVVSSSISTWGAIQNTGTVGNPITYSGGWNRTDMTTQTGDTYIQSDSYATTIGISISAKNYINLEKLNFSRFATGISLGGDSVLGGSSNINYIGKDLNTCSANGISITSVNQDYYNNINISIDNMRGHAVNAITGAAVANISATTVLKNNITVINLSSNPATGLLLRGSRAFTYNITNLNRHNSGTLAAIYGGVASTASISVGSIVNIVNAKNNSSVFSAILGTIHINNIFNITGTVANNTSFISVATGIGNVFNLNNAIITGNGTDITSSNCSLIINGGIFDTGGVKFNILTNSNIILNNSSAATGDIISTAAFTAQGFKIIAANANNNPLDNRIYYNTYFGNILTDSSIRHTASGVSWKMTADFGRYSSATDYDPLSLPVAKIACNSGTLVTAKVWVYRTSTSLTTKFVCAGGQIAGVATDVSASASSAINTWEQLTITFTPSQQGVVELRVDCYGAAASVYVDDFSVSQA